jgi:hypothetical protein
VVSGEWRAKKSKEENSEEKQRLATEAQRREIQKESAEELSGFGTKRRHGRRTPQ